MEYNARTYIKMYIKIMGARFLFFLTTLAVVFISAGRLDYWQGWLFIAVTAILLIISFVAFASKVKLLKERITPGDGMKWWDKVFFAFYVPSVVAIAIVGGLDGGRFRWTAQLPASAYVISSLVYLASTSLSLWAMWINRYFSSVVRIQADRGHTIVQHGPYKFIRHPGYSGMILSIISVPFTLGSLWALVPAGIATILLLIRTYLEDHTLQNELPGYEAYTKKVRYRLLPWIW